jgi:hypothetical protein
LKGLDFRCRQRPNEGWDDLTKACQDSGIDGVGFGQDAECFGEVTDLAGVDHDGGQRGGEQGADGRLLIVARGLEDDAVGAEGTRPLDQVGDAGRVVGKAAFLRGRQGICVEVILTDIDAEDALHKSSAGRWYRKAGRTEGVTCSGW